MSNSNPSSDDSMASKSMHSPNKRAICPVCTMLLTHCLCDTLCPQASNIRVLVLQHPQESKHHKNTARLLALNIPNTQILIGERFDPLENDALKGLNSGNTLLLYPSDQSVELSKSIISSKLSGIDESITLIVIDASWKKSKKMHMINQWLHAFHSIHLKLDQTPSIYQIRKKRQEYFRSTLEASVVALNILEDYPIEPCYQLLDRFCELKMQDVDNHKIK